MYVLEIFCGAVFRQGLVIPPAGVWGLLFPPRGCREI